MVDKRREKNRKKYVQYKLFHTFREFTTFLLLLVAEVLLRNCSLTHLALTKTSAARDHMKVTKMFADRPKAGPLSSYSRTILTVKDGVRRVRG